MRFLKCHLVKHAICLFLLALLSIHFSACDKEVDGQNPATGDNTLWTAYLGSDKTVPAIPDVSSNYWTYSFVRTNPNMGIRMKGEYGDARYMSYNVYNVRTATSVNALLDKDIIVDCCGAYNPFSDPVRSNQPKYTIEVITKDADSTTLNNVLSYPSDIDSVSIFLRYYLPERTNQANVELPTIEAFDVETGETLDFPTTIALENIFDVDALADRITSFFNVQMALGSTIGFYNVNNNGLFANLDNQYLAAPITKRNDEVYIIRFKPPTHVSELWDIGDSKEVRFWSINQSTAQTTTELGWADKDFVVADSDGFVNIVIADDESELRTKAEGLNFMPWSVESGQMLLVYRNLVTHSDFAGNIAQVPLLDGSNLANIQIQQAKNFIGEYAPIGMRMSKAAYLENFGGFEVSY